MTTPAVASMKSKGLKSTSAVATSAVPEVLCVRSRRPFARRLVSSALAALCLGSSSSAALSWIPVPSADGEQVLRRSWLAIGALTAGGLLVEAPQPAEALVGSTLSPEIEAVVRVKKDGVADFTTLPSGLKIADLVVGKDDECCASSDNVIVDWSMRRSNFDQGRGIDERFGVGQTPELRFQPRGQDKDVIEGVKQAVLGMRVGGTRRVVVPPQLGFVSEDLQPNPTDWGRKRQIQRFRNQNW
eukprot:CAMPEP_0115162956 /NCGR_PEP_ID=MMETSP0227-20121206/72238_1 /TAXON_ID=89957 /ORGANISM="Polarella glacialis, Strain CCMP 1383" /LENGTH=242 /DNA_ID=CAMNT_0002575201 /DNA_START=30 /DNA_END=756 /DNA_ORIENTATION=-